MKSLLLIALLAAAATASVISNQVADVPEGADWDDGTLVTEVVDVTDEAELTDVAEVPTAVAIRRNLSVGTIGNRDRLLARTTWRKNPASNVIHVQDITFRGTASTRITAIRVRHVGTVQGSTSSIRSGGVGRNFVTIRLQSARSRGYQYNIDIYGR